MAWRSTAGAIVASIGVALLGCASGGKSSAAREAAPAATAARPASSRSTSAAPAVVRILQGAFNEDSDGARFVLSADAPLLYTAYEPRPTLFVLDLPGAELPENFQSPAASGNLVSSVRLERVLEMGRRLTRVTITHREGLHSDVHSLGQGLAVSFEPTPTANASAPAPAPPVEAAPQESPASAPPAAAPRQAAVPPVVSEPIAPISTRVERAHVLEEIRIRQEPGRVTVSLLGDGALQAKDFMLANPLRLVIDLPGVKNGVRRRVQPLEGGLVARVRVAQFQSAPELVTRVVLDLPKLMPHTVQSDGERVTIMVGTPVATAPISEPPAATPTTSVPPAPAPTAAPPPAAAARPAPQASKPSTSREDALFEAAAAVLAQEETPRQEPAVKSFSTRTISETQSQFNGEPISLDLKDADIRDVFHTIAQFTQLNIVVDPEVKGTVTVQLEDVPWDQVLDLILKQNGLGYVLENNIMRIATTAKLQSEQTDRARLAEARQSAEATRTVIKKLSYAKASELTPTLKSVMSKRGDIVVDARTNTLVIREIPTYLPAVLQLIENLDTATPQVMIEARIVETTKSFGRSLGINWGFSGVSDVAHGNTTGLIFPNNGSGSFRVPLETPGTIATVRLGNILNTFSLDVALSAAENQGLVKIISSPKVATLTNTAASIQSGIQIPVQTTVNNTTTVIYVDATLKLTVTPQITNEGTVSLSVSVAKKEPLQGFNLAGGQNVPISVREYKGEVLVRDGGTTVIGGIFLINDQDQNNMIPGLWKIPILGNLFRNKTRTEKHDELLIFITPRILRQ